MKIYNLFRPLFILGLMFSFASGAYAENQVKAENSPLSWSKRSVRKGPSAATKAAVSKFSSENGHNWTVRYNPLTGAPESLMNGRSSKRYRGRLTRERATSFLEDNAAMLDIDPSALKAAGETSFLNTEHVRYQQYYKGLPVEFTYTTVHLQADGTVTGYQSSYNSSLEIDIVPTVSVAQALQTAGSDAGSTIRISSHTLVIFPDNINGKAYLAWKIRGRSYDGKNIWVYYVDAHSGKVLFKYDDMRRFSASSKALVYEISPDYTNAFKPNQPSATEWQNPNNLSLVGIPDQYIWIKDYSTKMVTDGTGVANTSAAEPYGAVYCIGSVCISSETATGKIFSSFKGPYFTVTNMRGQSAHWDNGGGQNNNVASLSTPIVERPYYNNMDKKYATVSINPHLDGNKTFARQYPIFSAPFNVGVLDDAYLLEDDDEVYIYDNEGRRHGSYMGNRTQPFLGPSIESPDFSVRLYSNDSGTNNGFSIERSSYIVLTDNPNITADPENNIINWSTATMAAHTGGLAYIDSSLGENGTFGIDEPNVFYHLNKMRRYFSQFNKIGNASTCPDEAGTKCKERKPVNIDKHVDVMVHANGNIDTMFSGDYKYGMENAFVDLEHENILIGDGRYDGYNSHNAYRSFALDGTIIRHEYTHFLVHQIYNIINFGEFGAISEALSDYFSLASLWQEGEQEDSVSNQNLDNEGNYSAALAAAKRGLTKLGNFVDVSPRDLSKTDKILPGSWKGELYNDSQILSQALYSLRKNAIGDIGDYLPSNLRWGKVPITDLLVFASLFYFPDSFRGFYEAMLDSCNTLNEQFPGSCLPERITNAFSTHGMITGGTVSTHDDYESAAGGMCNNNNGPECAADITDIRSLQARIYPAGDLDYYSFTANAGTFVAQLTLPQTNNYTYQAYSIYLFDSQRRNLIEETPVLDSAIGSDVCYVGSPCITNNSKVTLTYNLPASGRYYLLVSPPTMVLEDGSNGLSTDYSENYYTLETAFVEQGHISAQLRTSAFDGDIIRFNAPSVLSNSLTNNIIWESTATYSTDFTAASENYFSHVQLWDVLGNSLKQANSQYTDDGTPGGTTNGRLIEVDDISMSADGVISGNIYLQKGFAARYPAIASVVVEVIGYNHMGAKVSLGKSDPVNLTASGVKFETYNNLLLRGQGEALIRYSVSGSGRLTIKAYTQTGKLVKVIADQHVSAGEQGNKTWDGTNDKGSKVASGIYFIKAEGPGLDKIEKIAIVR